MYVCGLHIILALDPAFDVNIWHFFTRKESIIFQDNIIRIPNDAS